MAKRKSKGKNFGCLGSIIILCFYIFAALFLLSMGTGILFVSAIAYFGLIILFLFGKLSYKICKKFIQRIIDTVRIKNTSQPSSYEQNNEQRIEQNIIPTTSVVQNYNDPEDKNQQAEKHEKQKVIKKNENSSQYQMSGYALERFARECNAYLEKCDREEEHDNS